MLDGRAGPRAPRIDAQALLDPANAPTVNAILQQIPAVAWDTNVHDHAAVLVDDVYRRLVKAFPLKARRMSRGYLSPETSDTHRQTASVRNVLRWQYHALHLTYLRCAFLAWSGSDGFFGLFGGGWLHELRCAIAVATSKLSRLGKQVRRLCRRDRNDFLDGLAKEAAAAPPGQVHVAIRRLLRPKKRGGSGPQPLPRLRTPEGVLCDTHEAVVAEWRRHFASLEGGVVVGPDTLARDCAARQAEWGVSDCLCPTELPSFGELVNAVRAVNPHKAAGPDLIPPAICRRFAMPIAHLLWPLLLKGALTASEPIGFKGGTLHHIPKPGAADRFTAKAQRGILVQPVFGKVLHRAIRRLPAQWFEAQAAPLQIGGRRGMTHAFGFFLSRGFLSFARASGVSAALIFADLAAAYYAVVREAVVRGTVERGPNRECGRIPTA